MNSFSYSLPNYYLNKKVFKKGLYCDYHVHTNYSDDSTYLMEDVIKDAIKMKMDEICFTDHVDYGIKKD